MDKEVDALFREKKAQAVKQTLNTLKKGMEEAEVCELCSFSYSYIHHFSWEMRKENTRLRRLRWYSVCVCAPACVCVCD